jgi:hypothetical protein
MYITSRTIAGDTLVACGDYGHAVSMNKICRTSLQSVTDMLKHMAAHKASRVLAAGENISPELAPVRSFTSKWMSA